jgi:hypothetical protein
MSAQPVSVRSPFPPAQVRTTGPMPEVEFREGQVIGSMCELPVTWDGP